MTDSCADPNYGCNCDADDQVWRNLLTDKTKLPVKQLRFDETWNSSDDGYDTQGKLKCYGFFDESPLIVHNPLFSANHDGIN